MFAFLPMIWFGPILGCTCRHDADWDGSPASADCDDTNPAVRPGTLEICDTGDTPIDNDCNGLVDDDDPGLELASARLWWPDLDGDGFGDATEPRRRCRPGPGDVAVAGDCDDADPAIHPGADELCDGLDNDCDVTTLEAGVAFRSDVGVVRDFTDALRSLRPDAAPLSIAIDGPGVLYACTGEWPISLDVTADLRIVTPDGPDHTIFTGHGLAPVLVVRGEHGPVQVSVDGLTVVDPAPIETDTFGGAVHCVGPADLSLRHARIAGTSVAVVNRGTAISVLAGCTLTLEDSDLRGGRPAGAGGILHIEESFAEVRDTDFVAGAAAYGGALAINHIYYREEPDFLDAGVTCERCRFIGNFGILAGGAIVVGPNAYLSLSGGSISDNEGVVGGGVLLGSVGDGRGLGSAQMDLSSVEFVDNLVSESGATSRSVLALTMPEDQTEAAQSRDDFEGWGPVSGRCDDRDGCTVQSDESAAASR